MVVKSSSSSSGLGCTFDVFLSFRGKDTRKNFTDHLYIALVQAGIHTFRDNDELPRGEQISPQLLNAIHESRISIIVFSKGYAASRWCLNELVEILDCKNMDNGHIVLPIFYDIDPLDVRKQTGSFKEAFDRYEECYKEEIEKVNKWKQALVEAGNLSGLSLKDIANGYESKFIEKIVEEVLTKLDCKYSDVANHPVAIDSRVEHVISLLNTIAKNDVGIVGIHGMPGIGKTTIAKAVFNELYHGFKGGCFLFNINEISERPDGQIQLQKQLLHDILGLDVSKVLKLSNVDRGISLIKERLGRKRVLVVLDDVDRWEQLNALMAEQTWFGSGSRIIITTRNEELLDQLEAEKYHAKELNPDESLQLFSCYAFKDTHPVEDFVEHSIEVVDYCRGLPLALQVLGSHFSGMTKHEWQPEIDNLRKIPNDQVLEKLKTSFDRLDIDLQGMFLDIASFFIGTNKEYVAEILKARYRVVDPIIGFKTLSKRSLITINSENELRMHDLLRDMGRAISRKKSPCYPGDFTRIWRHEDAWDVLHNQMGTKNVEGLILDVRGSNVPPLSTESFREMSNLQLLKINGLHLTGCFKHLHKTLIWLCWHEFPLKFLPSNFQLNDLVVLDMQYSKVKELWKGTKSLNKLKILNLSYCKHLAKSPNLHSSSVQKLMFEGCSSLREVHKSIGHLVSLVFLNFKGCCKLKNLPESLSNLKSLETLNVTKCLELDKLPECLGNIESLVELLADGTAIRQLPSSIGHLKNLKKLSFGGCSYNQNLPSISRLLLISSRLSPRISNSKALLPASFFGLRSLRELNLSYCCLADGMISKTDFGRLSCLEYLYLSGNKFFNLPSGIGSLPSLWYLGVQDCTNLVSIRDLPSGLQILNARYCTSMKRLSIPSKTRAILELEGCRNLQEIESMEGSGNGLSIYFGTCSSDISSYSEMRAIQVLPLPVTTVVQN